MVTGEHGHRLTCDLVQRNLAAAVDRGVMKASRFSQRVGNWRICAQVDKGRTQHCHMAMFATTCCADSLAPVRCGVR